MTDPVHGLFAGRMLKSSLAEADFYNCVAKIHTDHPYFQRARTSSYTFLSLDIGQHSVALIFHQSPKMSGERTYANIDHVIIADPYNNIITRRFVWSRLV